MYIPKGRMDKIIGHVSKYFRPYTSDRLPINGIINTDPNPATCNNYIQSYKLIKVASHTIKWSNGNMLFVFVDFGASFSCSNLIKLGLKFYTSRALRIHPIVFCPSFGILKKIIKLELELELIIKILKISKNRFYFRYFPN